MIIKINPVATNGICEQCKAGGNVYNVTISNGEKSVSKNLCDNCAAKAKQLVDRKNQSAPNAVNSSEVDASNAHPASGQEKRVPKKSIRKKMVAAILAAAVVLSSVVAGLFALKDRNKNNYEDVGEIYYQETPEEHIAMSDAGIMYADNELLVVAKDGVKKSEIEKLAKKYDATIVGFIEKTGDYQWKLNNNYNDIELKKHAELIANEKNVFDVKLNYVSIISVENNDNYTDWLSDIKNESSNDGIAWSYKAANVIKAWDVLNSSKNSISPIKVGVVDTCFDDTTQDDLHFAQTFYNEGFHDIDEWYKSNNITRHLKMELGHGTHVAGVFAASSNGEFGISGVYPCGDNNLYGVSLGTTADNTKESVYDKPGNGNNYNSAMGFKVALSELILRNVKVINFSFSSSPLDHSIDRVKDIEEKKEGWEEKFEELQVNANVLGSFLNRLYLLDYDFVLVSAAGNSSSSNNHLLESKYNSFLNAIKSSEFNDIFNRIIVVGSLGKDLQPSWFSCGGQRVDIFAPGEKIFSTLPGNMFSNHYEYINDNGQIQYDDWSGTSMASPLIAGVAAMAWSINPELSGENIKNIICDSKNTEENAHMLIDAEKAVITAAKYEVETKVSGQNKYGSVQGFVVDDDNLEVENNAIVAGAISRAEFVIKNSETGLEIEGAFISDEKGHFEFILPPGKYYITCNAVGYEQYSFSATVNKQEVTYLDDWIKLKKNTSQATSVVEDQKVSAEELIDIYLSNFSLWSKDEHVNLESAEHKYQFLDLDFDGIPELVVSVGNGMRGDSFNNYYHIDLSNKKVLKYEIIDEEDDANQSSLYNDVMLVQNSATGGKEYRTECHRASRLHSYILKKAITLKNGKVSDQSIYGKGTEYDDSGNERDLYYRFDSNFQEVSLSKSEYDRLVSADQAACKDLHLKFTKLDGEAFDALSKSEKKAQLLNAFISYTYDGFVPGYTKADKQTQRSPTSQEEEFPMVSAAYAKAVADYYTINTVVTDYASAKQKSDQLMHQFTAELRKNPSYAPFPNNGNEKYWFILAHKNDDGSVSCLYVPDVNYHEGATYGYADIEFQQVEVFVSRNCIYALYPEPETVFAHGMLPQIAEEKAKAFVLKQYPDYENDNIEVYCMDDKIYVTNYDKETAFYVDYAFTKAEKTRYQGQIEYYPE